MSRPDEVIVREAVRADLLSVFRIERTVFSDPWPYDAFERLLREPAFLVAEREPDSAIVGYVVADVTPNYGRDIGHVKDIAVRPDEQGRGFGGRLLAAGLSRLRMQGASVVKLEVRKGNERAQSLYRSHGFETLRRVNRYYQDGEDAIVMVLDLEAWASESG
ncbi:ribosomal protein S18-alanine N-acetyltransferase [Halopenitus salinus]|uniref:Ribosomal protein S18-alanine N-acetyltransferase n=1 Tax=Halopenitus salinus TaxID=1198295 RepID=A0ABD5UV58_9EURY